MAQMLLEGEKARNVTTIVWLEDLQKLGYGYYDFAGYLQALQMECCISPLHDRDMYTPEDVRAWLKRNPDVYDPETGDIAPENVDRVPKVGDPKKSHIHLMLRSKGARTGKWWSSVFEEFGLTIRENSWAVVGNVDSTIRYMAHLDNHEKAQYDALDVLGFGGIDLSPLVTTTGSEKLRILVDLQEYVLANGIKTYRSLVNYAFGTHNVDYIACVTGRASYWTGYFNSWRTEEQDAAARKKAEEMRAAKHAESAH